MPGPSWTHPNWRNFFRHVITGDESWIFEYDPKTKRQSSEWHRSNSPRPKKARMSKSKIKSTLICFFDAKVLFIRNSCVKDKQLINSTILRSLNYSEKGFIMCGQRLRTLDAASRQRSLSHCHLRERIFDQKVHSTGSAAPIFAWSESVWLLPFLETQIPPPRSSFWNFGQHPKGRDRPAEGTSTWRLPTLQPGLGATSPAVCGFPRELTALKGIMLICSSVVNNKFYSTSLIA